MSSSVAQTDRIDVLKIDCEGCEWDAFADLVERSPQVLERVDQVVLELHLRRQYQLKSMTQLTTLMEHLLVQHSFRVFQSRTSPGFHGTLSHTHPPAELAAAGFETNKYVCVELSLMRAPPGSERM